MNWNAQNQAILLLTAPLAEGNRGSVRPLGTVEWGSFARWLRSRKLTPENLLDSNSPAILEAMVGDALLVGLDNAPERVRELLGRGTALAVAAERWSRAGAWVYTRADAEYPRSLKTRLGDVSPPILFGYGDPGRMARIGVGLAGQKGTVADIRYLPVVEEMVRRGVNLVAQTDLAGNLIPGLPPDTEGGAVLVADTSLLQLVGSKRYRTLVQAGSATLISMDPPESQAREADDREGLVHGLSAAMIRTEPHCDEVQEVDAFLYNSRTPVWRFDCGVSLGKFLDSIPGVNSP